ncbi:prepilin-type N-terminal cleavage/methylation domain-containing protein [[Clostridium] fimetarium]|uniref:Prepilin-type N-terminal cleavage/methylation domain-containing protein n=1 Tax=[Clostridium] fimetarium TaxID=99656 RepID=A0A1I0N0V4_9FIRM|nr:prepilin-type N-terminal cleavage/methylation domain-containing protein [[Clostridium] fimetarium]SEV94441.1 prepilin-type N-terminal cleavage/methylation domain-containing protein [[Clostridium] fimetarium]
MELFLKSIKRKHNTDNSTTKTDNKGFSLIEVLVAMVILAIITLPILSSFASAAKVNSNARKQENANTVAQKIIEEFKSLPITQLTDGHVTTALSTEPFEINNSATGVANLTIKQPETAPLVPKDQLIYQFDMASFEAGTPKTYVSGGVAYPYYEGANGERYFVKVTLDPSSYADKSSAPADNVSNNINTYNMPVLSDVNTDRNYVIMQQVYQHDSSMINAFKKKGVDVTIAEIRREVTVTSEVTKDSMVPLKINKAGATASVQTYKQNLVVEVTYFITKAGADLNKSITYKYDYTTFPDSNRIVENAADINEFNNLTNASAYNEFRNVYLFYRAFDINKAGASTAEDVINVKYKYPMGYITKDKLNVYLVEQTNVKDVNPVKLDKSKVKVEINDTPVILNNSGTLGLGSGGTVDIYSNIDGWDKFVTTAANQKNSITQNVSAGDGTKYLYNIKVEIWVGEKTGDPFMTMTSTKEN